MTERHETPTQVQVRLILEKECKRLADLVSAELPPGQQGFALFLFDFGADGNLAYVGNGARQDVVALMRGWLARMATRSVDQIAARAAVRADAIGCSCSTQAGGMPDPLELNRCFQLVVDRLTAATAATERAAALEELAALAIFGRLLDSEAA